MKILAMRPTSAHDRRAPASDGTPAIAAGLLYDLVGGRRLATVVPAALDLIEREPLATGGFFRGDILRGLMEVPGHFWWRSPDLLARYGCALQSAAALRRTLTSGDWARFCAPIAIND